MILEMPQEITGQLYRTVLCQGEVVRGALRESGVALAGLLYRTTALEHEIAIVEIRWVHACLLPKLGLEYRATAPGP